MGEKDWPEIPDAVKKALVSKSSGVKLTEAIEKARLELFKDPPANTDVRRILLIFTSKPSVNSIEKEVTLLHQENVKIVFIVDEIGDEENALTILLKDPENIITIGTDGVDSNEINNAQNVLSKSKSKLHPRPPSPPNKNYEKNVG